jgi:hypothetical protein
MRVSVAIAAAACLGLSGCDSNLNPVNWFGGDQPGQETVRLAEVQEAPADPRPLIDQVTALSAERVPGGILLTAVGLPPTQGWFAAELVPEQVGIDDRPLVEDGVLALRFVAVPPPAPGRVGPERSRQITAGLFLSSDTVAGARSILVRGDRANRSVRP